MQMFLFVLAVLFAVPGIYLAYKGKFSYKSYSGTTKHFPVRAIGVSVLGLAGLFGLFSFLYTQDPGEVILIRGAGGDVIKTDDTAGFGLTAPWNKKTKFNIRNQRIEMFTNESGNGTDGAAISAPLKNGSNVGVSITVQVDIKPNSVSTVYKEQRGQKQLWENVLKPGLRDEVRRATANYTAFDVKQSRGDLVTDITNGLAKRWERVGVSVNNVDLGDLQLDPETEKALAELSASQTELEEERVNGEKQRVKAKAATDADQIVRCGATVTTEKQVVADKEIDVTVVTPKTGAACENRLNEQVLAQNYIEALEQMAKDGTVFVVPQGFEGILNLPTSG